jgi:Periplasmic sensor domain found in signal transduction proteins
MGEARWGGLHDALFDGNGVAKRLLLAVVLFSTLITTLITGLDLYRDYQGHLSGIRSGFEAVKVSQVPSLSRSVWQLDGELIQSQLDGLLGLHEVEYADVEVNGRVRWSAGETVSQRRIEAALPLVYQRPDGHQAIWWRASTAPCRGCGAGC